PPQSILSVPYLHPRNVCVVCVCCFVCAWGVGWSERWGTDGHLPNTCPPSLPWGRAGPGQDWDWQWSSAAAPALAREREPRIPEAPGFPGAPRIEIGDRSGGALGPHPAPALSPQRGRPAPRAPDVDAAAAAAAAARESLSAEPICRQRGPARGGRAGRTVGWSASGSGRRAQESPCPSGHRAPGRPAPRSACGWAASASRWCRRVRGPGSGDGRKGCSLPSHAATGEFSVPFPLPEDLLCHLLPTLLARPQRLQTFLTPRPVLQPLNLFPGILGS
ncbi:hypothetical protein LEMLEM_LOCUS5280, partial [Lemmus lemmus]